MSSEVTLKWVEVAMLDDLWEGEILDVEVDGEEVLLIHLPGEQIVAYQGICPHQETSLVDGEYDEETEVLTCGAHHWQFDVKGGEGVNPTGCNLYRYEVKVDDDEKIHVGYPEGDEQRYNRCREELSRARHKERRERARGWWARCSATRRCSKRSSKPRRWTTPGRG